MSKERIAIYKHIFKIDGCLSVSNRADTRQEAERIVKRMWPRSTVDFISTEFSHYVDDSIPSDMMVNKITMPKKDRLSVVTSLPNFSEKKRSAPKSIEESMIDAVGAQFAS